MFFYLIVPFVIAAVIGPLIIERAKKSGLKQIERNVGAVKHLEKQGTPMMGGLIFLIPLILVSAFYILKEDAYLFNFIFLIASTFAFGFIGYLDDSTKAKNNRNLGLNEKQKLILQFTTAFIMSFLWYMREGGEIIIPFLNEEIGLNFFFIIFMMFVITGTVNSVNLLDGMDGLATIVTIIYLIFYVYLGITWNERYISAYSLMVIGGLAGFLLYNRHPAKIFMGDTGSMALGGVVASLAIVSKTTLYIPIVGFIYLMEALSVIIQVYWYKRTKKRIFLMAPIHYHFEKKGLKETSVVALFAFIQLIFTLNGILGL